MSKTSLPWVFAVSKATLLELAESETKDSVLGYSAAKPRKRVEEIARTCVARLSERRYENPQGMLDDIAARIYPRNKFDGLGFKRQAMVGLIAGCVELDASGRPRWPAKVFDSISERIYISGVRKSGPVLLDYTAEAVIKLADEYLPPAEREKLRELVRRELAVELGRRRGAQLTEEHQRKAAEARAEKLSAKRRSEIASLGAKKRWEKKGKDKTE